MKSVERGDYIAANFFEESLRDGSVTTRLIQSAGCVSVYNTIVGNTESSLLLHAAAELQAGHSDAGALALQAQLELTRAGCVKPQPPIRAMQKEPSHSLTAEPAAGPDTCRVPEMSAQLVMLRNRRQTLGFMPYARKELVRRRLGIANPTDMYQQERVFGGPLPAEVVRTRNELAKQYDVHRITYWDEACYAVGGDVKSAGSKTPRRPEFNNSAILTEGYDLTQLSMVLDVAHPDIKLSLARLPSFIRRTADKYTDLVYVYDSFRHSRQSHGRMKFEAERAVLGYVQRTRGRRLNQDPRSLAIGQLIAEADRYKLIGLLPDGVPNAAAINEERLKRITSLSVGGSGLKMLPEDVAAVSQEARELAKEMSPSRKKK